MDPLRATSAARFLPISCEVAADLGPGPIGHVASTGSTNTDLVREARTGDASPAVLVADHQTAGKGRLDRTWEDSSGAALLVSLRLPAALVDAAGAVRALGAAARAATDRLCVDPVLTKWPNDLVVVDGARPGKLAGVLAEFVDGPEPCVVVGIGVNVRPAVGRPEATSLVECGGADDRDALLAELLRELAPRLRDGSAVLDELRAHSATIGSPVRADLPGGRVLLGDAVDLSADGALIVRTPDGVDHVVGTGDVIHLRPG
ncbi:MAG: biotin--[acetyl-CoA-carboxylase] ligase [Acidimicrobiales bacterium]